MAAFIMLMLSKIGIAALLALVPSIFVYVLLFPIPDHFERYLIAYFFFTSSVIVYRTEAERKN